MTPEPQPIDQLYKNFADKSIKGAFVVYSGTNIPHLYGLVNALFTKDSALNVTGYSSDDGHRAAGQGADVGNIGRLHLARAAGFQGRRWTDLQSAPLYQPTGGLLHTTKLAGVEAELLGGANLAKISVTG